MVVALALCLFLPALRAQTATENCWIATAPGHWDVAANWSLGHVPYSVETVRIDDGTVSANTIGSTALALNGGTLTITGSLNNLSTTVGSGATLVIAGDASHFLTGTLTNHGAIIWQGGDINGDSYSSSGHIINAADGVFDIWCDKSLGSALTFDNQGSLYKNLGTNPNFTSVGAAFTSSGSISVRAGSLNVERIVDLSGSVTAADGTTIRLNAYSSTPAPISLAAIATGTGDVRLSGNFAGTLSGQARLVMGLEGDLTIAPASTIAIGDQYGDSSFRLTGTLTNHGALLWQNGNIDGDSFASLTGHLVNESDGVFEIWCDKSLGSALSFDNWGAIYKDLGTNPNFTSFGAAFTSAGSVSVRAGSLNIERILDLSGSVTAANGTTIRLNSYSPIPATIALHSSATGTGDVRLSGNFAGTLSGQARLVMDLEGDLTIASASTIAIGDQYSDSPFLLTGTLTNHGILIWQNGDIDGNAYSALTGHLVNDTDGLIDIRCSKSLGSTLTFDNQGSIYKNLGTTPNFTSFGAAFTSSGSIFVNAGSLNIERILELSGSVTAADATTIRLNSYSTIPAPIALHSSATGTGDVRLSGNFAGTLSGQARLVMDLEGDLTIAPASTIAIGDQYSDSPFRLTGTLTNHGALLWQYGDIDGDSFASLTGHLVNETDGVVDLWCDKSLGSFLTFNNRGSIYKNRGELTSISCAFQNEGRIELRSGTLSFSHSFQQTDGATKLAGGNISITAPAGLCILGGELTGAGAITGHVTLTGGSIIPGDALGTPLSIDGNLELAATATLVSTARGTALSDFGRLVVSGNTVLDGNLAFSLGNGFVPALGHRFQVIRSSSIRGSFGYSAFPAQPAATKYFVRYGIGFAEIVTGISSFADWTAFHFGAETDPAIIGDNADPDADGVANLLEYAFDLDPFTASRVGLPTIALRPVVPGGPLYLTLTFATPASVTDLDFTPQVSGNLSAWLSGQGQTETVSDTTDAGIRTVVVRDTVPVSGGTRRFMRLQVQAKP